MDAAMTQHDTLHNAAALMLFLGRQEAESIFGQLPPEQAHQLRVAIAEVAQRPKPAANSPLELDVNFDEFEDSTARQSRLFSDSSRYVRAMLDQAFGLQTFAAQLEPSRNADATQLADGLGPAPFQAPMAAPAPLPGAGFERLKRAELGAIVQMLVAEHPQISATILTLLDLDLSTRVLNNIPPRQRADIVQRIARTQAIHPATQDALDGMLATLLDDREARRAGAHTGARRAAMLITGMGARIEATVLESIDSTDPALAQRILDKMDEESRP
jgi:flagellar motor switch protein FliG